MLRTDVTGTRPITQTDTGTTITSVASASQETLNRLALISVGKQFQAQIMSRLNDGTFLVRVADTTARMALPATAQAGDTVTLTLLSSDPRPTFILGDASDAAEQAIAGMLDKTGAFVQIGKTAPLLQANAATATAEQIPSSAMTTFSAAGRLVDNLLHAAQLEGASSQIIGQTPILPLPLFNADTLSQSLRNSLEYSGLFYESHLAQWANGSRTTEELMREPQARADQHTSLPAQTNPPRAASSLMHLMQVLASTQQGETAAQNASTQIPTINNQTAGLINQQLGALEQQRIAWQGELWPGQKFEWEIADETPHGASSEQETTWRSSVKFDMPTLGTISAAIHLSGGHLQIHVRTATDNAAATLRQYENSLADALDAAGSPLDILTVKRNELP